MRKVDLVVIDAQNDFCDPNGALFVPGADQDCKRIADFIKRVGNKLNDIHVTMDCHHYFDIAHPVFLVDQNGNHPDPFTLVSQEDIKNGIWRATIPNLQKHLENYVQALADGGRYVYCIWPVHCLIGSWGNNIQKDVFEALIEWEKKNIGMVNKVTKGSNFKTEHYSAVKADVPDPEDNSTQLNTGLITTFQEADLILWTGEALSHCLANTARDVADNFGDNINKFVLLTDASSNVPGFEKLGEDFIKELTAKGMQLSTTTEFVI